MQLKYAADTDVPVHRSRTEIQELILRFGVTKFGTMMEAGCEQFAFETKGRRYRFRVIDPPNDHPYVTRTPTGKPRPTYNQAEAWEKLRRVLWRTLVLSIKARLAEVELGMTSFEDAFLAETILPSGQTVAEATKETIALAYQGRDVPLLPPA
ncbi:MAG: hypothetical protein RJA36_1483 [Pseudomonadota bacterium]